MSGVREEVSRKISDYENLISQLNKINIKLLQDITSLQDSLPSATELEQKKLSRRLVKLQSKLDRGIRDVTAYEREVVVRKTEAQELFSHIV